MTRSTATPVEAQRDGAAAQAQVAPTGATPDLRMAEGPRRAATEALIRAMAQGLGLRLEGLTVAVDAGAGRALGPHAARGRAGASLVELDPGLFDPGAASGRALLAHELSHAAQARMAGAVTTAPRRAEAEARANGARAALGRPLIPVLERLTAPAFEAPATDPRPAVLPLETLVARNYAPELAAIERLMAGLIVTDGEVERALRILEPLAFETATALIAALGAEARMRLIGEVDRDHYARYQTPIVAVMAALQEAEIARLDGSFLEPLQFEALSVAELIAVQRVFRNLPHEAQVDLSEGRAGAGLRALRRTVPGAYDAEAARAGEAAMEERRAVSVVLGAEALRARVHALSLRLQGLLASPDRSEAQEALDLIAGLDVTPMPDPRSEPKAGLPTQADADETEARRQGQGAARPPVAEDRPAPPQDAISMAALRIIAADLDAQGAIDRLIARLPADARREPARGDAFRLLISARAPHLNLALVEELLDPGWWIFGWVDKREAMLAYDIVMAMPLAERERFRALEDGAALRRMLDALPDEFRRSDDFRLPEVARNAEGELIEAERLYAPGGLRGSEADLVGTTLTMFRDAEPGDPTAPRLDRLLSIARLDVPAAGDVRAGRPSAVLPTLVRHLDAEGLLDPFLQGLAPEKLTARDTWPQMAAIMAARDPMLARARILDLLDDSGWFQSVDPREAFLAFQLVRALPQSDREALEAAQGGAPWGRMLENLSNRTLGDAAATWFRAELDETGTNAIRLRLDDHGIWDGTHDDQLIAVIEMALAAGEGDYVFETSELLHRAGRPASRAIVARYLLYDPAAARTAWEEAAPDLQVDHGSVWGQLFGARWKELDFNYSYTRGPEILGSEYIDSTLSSIRLTADLEQLQHVRGGRLHHSAEVSRSPGERAPVTTENRDALRGTTNVIDVLLDLETGQGLVTARELRLDTLRNITGASTLRTGPVTVSGLRLEIGFERASLIALTRLSLDAAKMEVETPVVAAGDGVQSARRASVTTLHMAAGDFTAAAVDDSVAGHVFGMVVSALWRLVVSGEQLVDDPLDRLALFDRIELSFADLTVEEFHTSGGQRVGQVSVRDARMAAATNRAAYSRLLIASLRRRIGRTDAGETREELEARLEAAEADLARMEPLEMEYLALVRRLNDRDGRLTPEQSRRLAELQEAEGRVIGGAMGGIVDIGQITVADVDGSMQVDDMVIEDLHGEGEFRSLAGFSVEQLTTEQQIERFVRFGPQALQTRPEGGAPSDTSFSMELPSASISGIVVEGDIPSAADVKAARMELPGIPAFDAERARLDALGSQLTVFEGMRSAGEPEAPAARLAHRRRLVELRRELAALFGSSIGRLEARQVRLGAQPAHEGRLAPREGEAAAGATRARGNAHIGDLDLREVRSGAMTANRIHGVGLHGQIGLPQAGSGALSDPSGQFQVAVVGGDSLLVEHARLGATPNRADRILVEGFEGIVRLDRHGLSVENFRIENFTLDSANYRTATSQFFSHGATLFRDIALDLRIPCKAVNSDGAEGGPEARDPAFSRLDSSTLLIDRLHIGRIEADQLGYRGFDAAGAVGMEAIAEGGAFGDVTISDFSVRMPADEEMTMAGQIAIQRLEAAQVSGSFAESFAAKGQLDAGAQGAAPAITVGLFNNGDMDIGLNEIDLTEGAVDLRAGDGRGRVIVRRAQLSAALEARGDTWHVRSLRMPRVEMPRIAWASGATRMEARGAVLTDLYLRVDYVTEGEDRSRVELDELRIGSVSAPEIGYRDPPTIHVDLFQRTLDEGGAIPLIQGLLLEDLTIAMGPDSLDVSGGRGRIDNADFVASTVLTATEGTDADRHTAVTALLTDVDAEGITFADLGYSDDGLQMTGGIDSFDIEGGVQQSRDGATTMSTDLSITHGRIGSFRYGAGLVQIGPGDSEGLVIDEIELGGLTFDSGNYKLEPSTSGEATGNASTVTAEGLELKMDLHLRQDRPEGEAPAPGSSPTEQSAVERIDIRRLHLDRVALQGQRLLLRDKGVYIDIPRGLDASISNIDLHGPLPGEPFSIRLDTPTPTLLGSVSTGAMLARQIGVQMGANLRTRLDFEAVSGSMGFLEAIDPESGEQGPITVDLTNWSATNILAYVNEGHSTRLRAGRSLNDGGIGGSLLAIEMGEDGSMSAKLRGLWARGFELRDQDLGAALLIGRARMPDDAEITYDTGPSNTASDRNDTSIVIENLDVEDAGFYVVDLAHMIQRLDGPDIEGALTGERTRDPSAPLDTDPALLDQSVLAWIRNHEALFDSLEGSLSADIQLPLDALGVPATFTLHPQIDMQIDNGSLDFDQMEDQIARIDAYGGTIGVANLKFDPHTAEPTLVLGLGGHVPVQPTDPGGMPVGDPLEADFHYNILEWRMSQNEMRSVQRTRRVPISRLAGAEMGNFENETGEEEVPSESVASQYRGLSITRLDLDLSTGNTAALPLSLGDFGSLELAPQALQNLSIGGDLQPLTGDGIVRAMHADNLGRAGNFGLSLEKFALQALDIDLPAFASYVDGGITGELTISNVHNVSLDFQGLVPRTLSGRVGGVALRNLRIDLTEFVPTGPVTPAAPVDFAHVPIFREGEPETPR